MKTIAIKYVGKKDAETDHLYGTGITWTGHGDVQQVPEDKAAFLLKHPDVWVDGRSAAARKKSPVEEQSFVPERYQEQEDMAPVPAKVHLMPKDDLISYAMTNFGERLSPEITEEQARHEVVRLMHTRG